jgi:alpha-tubulin suppressor-like RCC1 family protein
VMRRVAVSILMLRLASTLVPPPAMRGQKMAMGLYHACAIVSHGGVDCWGSNRFGQLGVEHGYPVSLEEYNSESAEHTEIVVVQTVPLAGTPVSVVAGELHTCCLMGNGDVMCWGRNSLQELGVRTYTPFNYTAYYLTTTNTPVGFGRGTFDDGSSTYVPQKVPLPSAAVAISAGEYHACVILDDGKVVCWGSNVMGESGAIGTDVEMPPVTISLPEGLTAVDISCYPTGTSVLMSDGSLYRWGVFKFKTDVTVPHPYSDVFTARTPQTMGIQLTPLKLPMGDLSQIGIEQSSTVLFGRCAIFKDQELRCWGSNSLADHQAENGTLGTGTNEVYLNHPMPVLLPDGLSAQWISSNGWKTFCAILSNRSLACWGDNSVGIAGVAVKIEDHYRSLQQVLTPAIVDLPAGVTWVVGTTSHTCAVLVTGYIMCWGDVERVINRCGPANSTAPHFIGTSPTCENYVRAFIPSATTYLVGVLGFDFDVSGATITVPPGAVTSGGVVGASSHHFNESITESEGDYQAISDVLRVNVTERPTKVRTSILFILFHITNRFV